MGSSTWEVSKYGVFSGLYFPVFTLNREIYEVNLRIWSKYGKIRTKKLHIWTFFTRWTLVWNRLNLLQYHKVNPLSANPAKWPNTLKQFVNCYRQIVWVCLTILWGWRLMNLFYFNKITWCWYGCLSEFFIQFSL